VIGAELFGDELFDLLNNNYQTSSILSYNNARDIMYSVIDIQNGNQLTGVYSGYTITLDLSQDPSTNAYEQNMNCEHTWPQSYGANYQPMKSDIHHLFPNRENVNSSRANDSFQDVSDEDTDKWWRDDYSITTIPTSDIDEYSEKYSYTNISHDNDRFEPREQQKGNTARAMFYFYTIYNDESNVDLDFWEGQEEVLLGWHYNDLPDETEINRSNMIASYQGNNNPYVIDPSLVGRVFLVEEGTESGDMNGDGTLDVIDLIIDISYIIGSTTLAYSLVVISDVNYDLSLDVLDVVLLVNSILQ
jgi:endonuclease I